MLDHMNAYSVQLRWILTAVIAVLSLGAPIGSVLAGLTGRWLAIDGPTYATLGLAVVALGLLPRLDSVSPLPLEPR